MEKKEKFKIAFKEALSDTGLAFVINVPLNFVLVAFAFRMEFTAFETSVMLNKTTFVNSISNYEVDCKLFFTNNCALTEFEILNVWNTQNATDMIPSNYSHIFELNT